MKPTGLAVTLNFNSAGSAPRAITLCTQTISMDIFQANLHQLVAPLIYNLHLVRKGTFGAQPTVFTALTGYRGSA